MTAMLERVDAALFHFINFSLSNPLFDRVMPLASNPPFLGAIVAILFVVFLWKGPPRARLCVTMLILTLCVGDWIIADLVKHAIARPRPFLAIPDARVLVGRGGSFSMPSSHAMNWFGTTMILFLFYRRSLFVMLPLAIIVSFSRVYNGVHYPRDRKSVV